jgi:predicted aspartyl protease
VDTGASYTWVPRDVLERLGVSPRLRRQFELADGAVIQRELAETPMRLNGEVLTRLVVFGDEGSLPLLGADTLEGFSLAPDPVNRRLIPVRGFAMAAILSSSFLDQ